MLKIRLQRVGKKHDPSFRVVLVDSRRSTKSGSFIDVLGSYDARKGKPVFQAEKIKEWIAKGAMLSATTNNLLVKEKIIPGKMRRVLPAIKKKEGTVAAAAEQKTEAQPAKEAEAAK